ncbi:hypothetical protein NOR_02098 [Metarhizium rileyi]|uniref:Rhodopsin domain-containing protein n=1 Tax=Metarhizium rileyi (strain RCEF 4871) TaxID=1649241 RepID=A0A162JQH4_METRR|nr:hypothetical protein NOR_02098 [Metarhizium rileyi RCEF 4871]
MPIYTNAPDLRAFRDDKPTLLVCWWATSFCTLMILLRVLGRFIRTERLFIEDKIAALAVIPLILRMVCVHFILKFGTNNANFSDVDLTAEQLHQKTVASGLVLLSRFFYASTLWTLKYCILEFLKRITDLTWEKSHHTALVAIRWTLLLTFIAVVISDLAECQPFNGYWQVLPDPGGQCRQGYAQLITMATCDIFTDLLLVIFPVPIILRSNMVVRRKVQLVLLFSLSLSVVAITIYRVPRIIQEHGRQQYRSLLASVELLFATAASNALVLGSFVRDRGVKKQKFHRNSAAESFDRSSNHRRPTLHRQWGSDEDLVRDVGLSVDAELRGQLDSPDTEQFALAGSVTHGLDPDINWQVSNRRSHTEQSDDSLLPRDPLAKADHRKKGMSFLDVGGLLEESVAGSSGSNRRGGYTSSTLDPNSPNKAPPPSVPASSNGVRRGSTALLQDLGGLLGPFNTRAARTKSRAGTELQTIPQSREIQPRSSHVKPSSGLMDPDNLPK